MKTTKITPRITLPTIKANSKNYHGGSSNSKNHQEKRTNTTYNSAVIKSNYKQSYESSFFAAFLAATAVGGIFLSIPTIYEFSEKKYDEYLENQKIKDFKAACIKKGAGELKDPRNRDLLLHYAISYRDITMVELLLKKGYDVDKRNANGESALHIVMKTSFGNGWIDKYRECAKKIVEKSRDVDALDNFGRTPLHIAAMKAYRHGVEDLLKIQSSTSAYLVIDNIDGNGDTPIVSLFKERIRSNNFDISFDMYALAYIAKLLVLYGASLSAIVSNNDEEQKYTMLTKILKIFDDYGSVPFYLKEEFFKDPEVKLKINWNPTNFKQHPFMILTNPKVIEDFHSIGVSMPTEPEKIRMILERNFYMAKSAKDQINGINNFIALIDDKKLLECKNSSGETLLHNAVQINSIGLIFTLINSGKMDINAVDNKGESVLHKLTYYINETNNPNLDIMEPLLSKKIINKDDLSIIAEANEKNLLLYAQNFILFYFLKKGVNINFKDNKGNTPLHLALLNGKENLTLELLKFGADKNFLNKEGLSPISTALKRYEKSPRSSDAERIAKSVIIAVNQGAKISDNDKAIMRKYENHFGSISTKLSEDSKGQGWVGSIFGANTNEKRVLG